jgi:CRP-like cAMP-binding protein
MTKDQALILSSCPLFKGVSDDEVLELFNKVPYSMKSYNKDALLMIRGDAYDSLKILIKGEVSAEIQDFNGKTIKIENLKAPDALATGILFADDNTLPVTLVAQSEITLISIPKVSIVNIAQNNKHFLLNYFSDSGNKVVYLAEKIRLFKFKSLRQKFTGYILSLSDKQNSLKVKLPYTREKLAELFGVARPSLSRVCSEMSDEGLVRLEGKIVTIKDKKLLQLSLSED